MDLKRFIKEKKFKPKLLEFLKWVGIDTYRSVKYGRTFDLYGITFFCGRQGDGKSASMVEWLGRMREKYPQAKILCNFDCDYSDELLDDWDKLLNYRNGENGVIFCIDEIQNEFNNQKYKEFPEFLLGEITMQRKQKVKIAVTSQVFTRVVIQLREQAFEVVECKTLMNRWTFQRCFDAEDYNRIIDMPSMKNNMHRKWRYSFVQTDDFRNKYDTYEKIQRMSKESFLPRNDRKGR